MGLRSCRQRARSPRLRDDAMTNPGACPECGQNYRRREFSTDWLGRVHLTHHICDPKVVERFQASELLARKKYTQQRRHVFTCAVCKEEKIGTHVQRICDGCRKGYWREYDRLRMAEKKRLAS